jgi:uncharacterized protein (DUF2236 family)
VHAALVDSALLFESLTVGALDDAGRQRFHEEQMLAAELVGLPRERIPPTVPALRAYIADVVASGVLRVGEEARRIGHLFRRPPRDAQWRPVLPIVGRLGFATLPPGLRELYGVRTTPLREAAIGATFGAARRIRPLLPGRVRYIAPYHEWLLRTRGRGQPGLVEWSRRRVGIRIDDG